MGENTKAYHFIANEAEHIIVGCEDDILYLDVDDLTNDIVRDICDHNYQKAIEAYESKLIKQILNLQKQVKQVKQFKQLLKEES